MHTRTVPTFALAVTAICLCHVASVRGEEKRIAAADIVHATLLADVDAAVPGSAFTVGVRLKIAPKYHTYWINPGEFGNATRIKLAGPAGFEFGEIQWPLPSRIEHAGSVTFGYESDVLLMVPVKVATSVPPSGAAKITADVAWLSCSDECIEGAAKLEIALPISAGGKAANGELFETWKKRLPISEDQPAAAEVISNQILSWDGTPAPFLTVTWKVAPAKVEWFPIATAAVAIENINVVPKGVVTHIGFKPTIYKPDQVPSGKIDSVLVYEDAKGVRHGIIIPVNVKK
jgi:DsbC/DsbD-like thiol-disulfide interchange protein